MDEHVIRTYLRAEEIFTEGEGAVLRDQQGKEYLDFLAGIAVSALGHNHPKLVAALREQVGQVIHVSNLYRHPHTEKVAGMVAQLTGLDSVFFTNSGAEANECALKIARKYHHARRNFFAMQGSFHGRTMGALSVTHTEKYRAPFAPLIPGVSFLPPGDEVALRRAMQNPPAALILEPIQGESGLLTLPHSYLKLCRRICDDTDTVLIHDEVQCGSGRSGTFLYSEQVSVLPDIVTLAKPIAAGLPMGMAVVSQKLADTLQPGDHGSTFAGGPLACRAALVFLQELQDGLLAQVQARGAHLTLGLQALVEEFDAVLERRGIGLMQGLRLQAGHQELQQWLYQNGLITTTAGEDVLRLLPPYVVTSEQIDTAVALIRQGLKEQSSGANNSGVSKS